MATQSLGVNAVNFTLDPQSANVVVFPVTDQNGANVNVSTGWTVKQFTYQPFTNPNPDVAPISLAGVGTFTFGNGKVTWNTPNANGVNPATLVNYYALVLSNDLGLTGSLSNNGQWTWDVENGLL